MLLARRHNLLSVPQRTVCRDKLRVLLVAAVGQGRPAVRRREPLARLTTRSTMPNKLTMAEARKIALLALEEAEKRRAATRERERRVADTEEALDVPAGSASVVANRLAANKAPSWNEAASLLHVNHDLVELVDGAYDIVEIWAAESPAQIAWKKAWMAKARKLGANPSW